MTLDSILLLLWAISPTNRISFLLFGEEYPWFDDTFVVKYLHLDAMAFTQFPNSDVSSELVNLILYVNVKMVALMFPQYMKYALW